MKNYILTTIVTSLLLVMTASTLEARHSRRSSVQFGIGAVCAPQETYIVRRAPVVTPMYAPGYYYAPYYAGPVYIVPQPPVYVEEVYVQRVPRANMNSFSFFWNFFR